MQLSAKALCSVPNTAKKKKKKDWENYSLDKTGQHFNLSEFGRASSVQLGKLLHLFPLPGIPSLRHTAFLPFLEVSTQMSLYWGFPTHLMKYSSMPCYVSWHLIYLMGFIFLLIPISLMGTETSFCLLKLTLQFLMKLATIQEFNSHI